jgi:hypothetical protein
VHGLEVHAVVAAALAAPRLAVVHLAAHRADPLAVDGARCDAVEARAVHDEALDLLVEEDLAAVLHDILLEGLDDGVVGGVAEELLKEEVLPIPQRGAEEAVIIQGRGAGRRVKVAHVPERIHVLANEVGGRADALQPVLDAHRVEVGDLVTVRRIEGHARQRLPRAELAAALGRELVERLFDDVGVKRRRGLRERDLVHRAVGVGEEEPRLGVVDVAGPRREPVAAEKLAEVVVEAQHDVRAVLDGVAGPGRIGGHGAEVLLPPGPQAPACRGVLLEDGDLEAAVEELAAGDEAREAGADDEHRLAVLRELDVVRGYARVLLAHLRLARAARAEQRRAGGRGPGAEERAPGELLVVLCHRGPLPFSYPGLAAGAKRIASQPAEKK